ncbi:DUF1569 domain-containing protein [Taibaiella koreensis]|uniref:DUF1569 domain-containing protein n=1 Tax=Taibaiella koreensis TaxID=1268548 RepID=UPI000E5A0CCA|nr:DUF1569 domain-containing protein [Taibaiella koreensis]
MKTIFDPETRAALTGRIGRLEQGCKAQWGKMNVYQMLRHCQKNEELFLGHKLYKRLLMGRLLGKIALRDILRDERPMKHNQPTHPEFRIRENGDNIKGERERWIALLKAYDAYPLRELVHPFFGLMTKEQIGRFVYKHTDHHLRQFGL